ncbi:hypothetical protein GIB67_013288 [Kingdonia uniflora]|uniref:Uncharacterized protein n=1 Tax=Kingdonia uniflora TaxID=39325 RepID=A0A7J7N6M0_9MAGN|nr:hypothetical protein GIB67_013288 [Kingdonia uniflora]
MEKIYARIDQKMDVIFALLRALTSSDGDKRFADAIEEPARSDELLNIGGDKSREVDKNPINGVVKTVPKVIEVGFHGLDSVKCWPQGTQVLGSMGDPISAEFRNPSPLIVWDKPPIFDKPPEQLLDGLNYVRWAQFVKLFVGGHGKIGFLLGTEKEPAELDLKYAKWFSDDSMVYSQRENNARIFKLFNEIGNFKQGTQTLGMYYARLRSSWEKLSHYDSFIEWLASAPSEKVPIPLTTTKIYAKIVEKTQVFQFLVGLNPDFEGICILSLRSELSVTMPPISGIPSETSAMAIHYAYPAPPSVPSQSSHTSSPSLSPLPTASGNFRFSRKKCDYCGKWGHLKTTCHALHGRPAGYQPRPSQSSAHLSADSSVPDSSAFSALSQDEISRFRQLLSMSSIPAASHAGNFASANSVSASPTSP